MEESNYRKNEHTMAFSETYYEFLIEAEELSIPDEHVVKFLISQGTSMAIDNGMSNDEIIQFVKAELESYSAMVSPTHEETTLEVTESSTIQNLDI